MNYANLRGWAALGVAWLGVLSFGACSSDNTATGALDGGNDASGDAPATDDGSPGKPGPDAGGDRDAQEVADANSEDSSDAAEPPDAGPRGFGTVWISEAPIGHNGPLAADVAAAFQKGAPPAQASCTRTTAGACAVASCPIPAPSGDAGAPVYIGAGTIDVGFPALDAGKDIVEPYAADAGSSGYAEEGISSRLGLAYSGGDSIVVTASGGDVPAFTTSLFAPGRVTVVSPAPSSAFPRDQDLAVTWTGGTAGSVLVRLTTTTTARSVAIDCVFPAASGGGAVPAAALANLDQAGVGSTVGALEIDARSIQALVSGGYAITITATEPPRTTAGGTYTPLNGSFTNTN